jgi:hypothetical protein
MIRKSGNRFSEKIMLHQKVRAPDRFNVKSSRSSTTTPVGERDWETGNLRMSARADYCSVAEDAASPPPK